jgi:hypothetical protein
MMRTDPRHANERNQRQERPLRKSAANCRNLAAVADSAVDIVLLEDLDITLWLLWRDFSAGNQRRSDFG